MRSVVGWICFGATLLLGGYYEYLQWFVHPGYTKPEMFWAYWPIIAMISTLFPLIVWGWSGSDKRAVRR